MDTSEKSVVEIVLEWV